MAIPKLEGFKRKYPRHRVELEVEFRPLGSATWLRAPAVNLSLGGLCLIYEERLPARCVIEVKIEITPNGETRIHHKTGIVAWHRKGQYGIEFLEV